MVSKIKTTLSLAAGWTAYFCSYLFPRSSRTWVCIGWHTNSEREIFADNAKYFFLYVAQHQPDITAVWIARDRKLAELLRARGYRSYSIDTFWGAYYSLRAGYTFVDAFMRLSNWQYSGGSKIIQLWHGKGMKKTGHDSPYSLQAYNRYLQPYLFVRFHRLIASSRYTAHLMASTFRTPHERVLPTGLPRNDVLFQEIPDADLDANNLLARTLAHVRKLGAQKTILYAPTFRPDGSNPLDSLDLKVLNEFLVRCNHHLIVILHPKFSSRKITIDSVYQHIHMVPAGYDSYPQLPDIDILITDYSSIYVDFLLLDRPIIFYTYDIAKYRTTMGLHEDFDALTPGPHTCNLSDLLGALESPDRHSEARAHARKTLFMHTDGCAAARITEILRTKNL